MSTMVSMDRLDKLMATRRPKGGTSQTGVKYVYAHNGGYRVRIRTRGHNVDFGVYDDLETAAQVAVEAKKRLDTLR